MTEVFPVKSIDISILTSMKFDVNGFSKDFENNNVKNVVGLDSPLFAKKYVSNQAHLECDNDYKISEERVKKMVSRNDFSTVGPKIEVVAHDMPSVFKYDGLPDKLIENDGSVKVDILRTLISNAYPNADFPFKTLMMNNLSSYLDKECWTGLFVKGLALDAIRRYNYQTKDAYILNNSHVFKGNKKADDLIFGRIGYELKTVSPADLDITYNVADIMYTFHEATFPRVYMACIYTILNTKILNYEDEKFMSIANIVNCELLPKNQTIYYLSWNINSPIKHMENETLYCSDILLSLAKRYGLIKQYNLAVNIISSLFCVPHAASEYGLPIVLCPRKLMLPRFRTIRHLIYPNNVLKIYKSSYGYEGDSDHIIKIKDMISKYQFLNLSLYYNFSEMTISKTNLNYLHPDKYQVSNILAYNSVCLDSVLDYGFTDDTYWCFDTYNSYSYKYYNSNETFYYMLSYANTYCDVFSKNNAISTVYTKSENAEIHRDEINVTMLKVHSVLGQLESNEHYKIKKDDPIYPRMNRTGLIKHEERTLIPFSIDRNSFLLNISVAKQLRRNLLTPNEIANHLLAISDNKTKFIVKEESFEGDIISLQESNRGVAGNMFSSLRLCGRSYLYSIINNRHHLPYNTLYNMQKLAYCAYAMETVLMLGENSLISFSSKTRLPIQFPEWSMIDASLSRDKYETIRFKSRDTTTDENILYTNCMQMYKFLNSDITLNLTIERYTYRDDDLKMYNLFKRDMDSHVLDITTNQRRFIADNVQYLVRDIKPIHHFSQDILDSHTIGDHKAGDNININVNDAFKHLLSYMKFNQNVDFSGNNKTSVDSQVAEVNQVLDDIPQRVPDFTGQINNEQDNTTPL